MLDRLNILWFREALEFQSLFKPPNSSSSCHCSYVCLLCQCIFKNDAAQRKAQFTFNISSICSKFWYQLPIQTLKQEHSLLELSSNGINGLALCKTTLSIWSVCDKKWFIFTITVTNKSWICCLLSSCCQIYIVIPNISYWTKCII